MRAFDQTPEEAFVVALVQCGRELCAKSHDRPQFSQPLGLRHVGLEPPQGLPELSPAPQVLA